MKRNFRLTLGTLRYLVFFALFTIPSYLHSQSVGINTTGAAPDPSAMLDVSASDKGVLIPRVQLNDVATQAPITAAPVEGLLIYNATGSEPVGYYYWDGAQWVKVATGSGGINSSFTLNGTTLDITDPGGTLSADLSPVLDSTDNDSVIGNEHNTDFYLSGNTLSVEDPGNTFSVDLSPYVDSTDNDSVIGNEYNNSAGLNGTVLEIDDNGGTVSQDLSALTDTSYWDRDPSNGYIFPSTLSDRVGIGTNTPANDLHVADADGNGSSGIRFDFSTDTRIESNDSWGDMDYYSDDGLWGHRFYVDGIKTFGVEDDRIVVEEGLEDNAGVMGNAGDVLTSTGAGVEWQAPSSVSDGDWDRDAANGYMFPTNMTDSVGVGTNTPSEKFHVHGDAQVDSIFTVFPSSSSFRQVISAGSGSYFSLYTDALYDGHVDNPQMTWDGMTIASEGTTFGDISYDVEKEYGWHYWLIDSTRMMRLRDTNLYLAGGTYNTTGADLAEEFSHSGELEEGDVVMIGDGTQEVVLYDGSKGSEVYGIVSSDPGVLLNNEEGKSFDEKYDMGSFSNAEERHRAWKEHQKERKDRVAPIALSGRAPCKVDASEEPIQKGDLLTASPSKKGYAKKLEGSGSYFAVALEDKNSGSGKIMVAIHKGYKGDAEKLRKENQALKEQLDALEKRIERLEEGN